MWLYVLHGEKTVHSVTRARLDTWCEQYCNLYPVTYKQETNSKGYDAIVGKLFC